jgi:hypothetical protein
VCDCPLKSGTIQGPARFHVKKGAQFMVLPVGEGMGVGYVQSTAQHSTYAIVPESEL